MAFRSSVSFAALLAALLFGGVSYAQAANGNGDSAVVTPPIDEKAALSAQAEEFRREIRERGEEVMPAELCQRLKACCAGYGGGCCDAVKFCEKAQAGGKK